MATPSPLDPTDCYLAWFGHLTLAEVWAASSLETLLTRSGFTVHARQPLDRHSPTASVLVVTDPSDCWRALANDTLALTDEDEEVSWHRPGQRVRMLPLLLERPVTEEAAYPSLDDLVDGLAAAEVVPPVADDWLAGVALRAVLHTLGPDERAARQTLLGLGHPEVARALVALEDWYAHRRAAS